MRSLGGERAMLSAAFGKRQAPAMKPKSDARSPGFRPPARVLDSRPEHIDGPVDLLLRIVEVGAEAEIIAALTIVAQRSHDGGFLKR
jgi:hypothetical protein